MEPSASVNGQISSGKIVDLAGQTQLYVIHIKWRRLMERTIKEGTLQTLVT